MPCMPGFRDETPSTDRPVHSTLGMRIPGRGFQKRSWPRTSDPGGEETFFAFDLTGHFRRSPRGGGRGADKDDGGHVFCVMALSRRRSELRAKGGTLSRSTAFWVGFAGSVERRWAGGGVHESAFCLSFWSEEKEFTRPLPGAKSQLPITTRLDASSWGAATAIPRNMVAQKQEAVSICALPSWTLRIFSPKNRSQGCDRERREKTRIC